MGSKTQSHPPLTGGLTESTVCLAVRIHSTSNAPPVSAPRLDPSGDREHSCTGIMGTALESKPACRRRRYLSNAVTDKSRWLQKACRVNPLASNSATIFSASIRLRRLRTICPSAGSFMSQVNHKPKHYNRCVSHTHTVDLRGMEHGIVFQDGNLLPVVFCFHSNATLWHPPVIT